jgi:hypothetical protein
LPTAARPKSQHLALGAHELRDRIEDATLWSDVLGHADAVHAVERILDAVVAVLRCDQGIPHRTRAAWDLVFADLAGRAVDDLTRRIAGHVHYERMVRDIVDELTGDDDDDEEDEQ